MNIQGWFHLGLTGLISLQPKEFSRAFFWKHQFFGAQPSSCSDSHIHSWLLAKAWLWLYGPLLAKWCFCFLICYLGWSYLFFEGASVFYNFMAVVTVHSDFGAQENKIFHCLYFFLFCLLWSDGTRCHDLSFFFFLMFSVKPNFSCSSFTLIKKLFSSSSLSDIEVVSSTYLRLLIFLPAILIPCNTKDTKDKQMNKTNITTVK